MRLSHPTTSFRRILTASFAASLLLALAVPPVSAATKPAAKKPAVGKPVQLSVPRLRINAAVEPVGLERSGRIGLPSRSSNVGWFTGNVRPGQRGHAILVGHLDSFFGPAVFWRLKNAKPGDDIVVTDERNRQYRFRVTNVKQYSRKAPLNFEDVFEYTTKTRLSLITCAGRWSWLNRSYSDNLVVTADAVTPSPAKAASR